MAGHSKWANIKHRKGAADKKRGIIFTKISKELMVSARLGGSDPASNNRLRIAVSKARAVNMPRDTIERAIKKGAGELEGQTFEEVLFEIYAPGGVGVLVEALTDKKTRTIPEIKSILNKYNWNLAEANAVSRLFKLTGYINLEASVMNEDEMMELVIEAGADDFRSEDGSYEIYTSIENYSSVSDVLSNKGIESVESGIRFMPLDGTEVEVTDLEQAQKILKVLEILEDNDDVQAVYHNMNVSDTIMAELEKE